MLMYPCQKFDPMQRRTQKTPRPANTRAGLSSNRTSESFLQGLGDKLRSQSAPAFIVAKIKLIKNGPSFQILLIGWNQKFCKAARFMFVIKVTIHHLQSIVKPESQFQVQIKSRDTIWTKRRPLSFQGVSTQQPTSLTFRGSMSLLNKACPYPIHF